MKESLDHVHRDYDRPKLKINMVLQHYRNPPPAHGRCTGPDDRAEIGGPAL
jgi:hypothetical protein